LPGAYKTDSSITIAARTVVTLRGNADSKFFFLSGASIVTGAGTTFNLVSDSVGTNGSLPLAENVFFMSAGATTTGANSVLQGSILTGAAVSLGAASVVTGSISDKAAITLGSASRVTGDIFARAFITIGDGSSYKSVLNEAQVQSSVNAMRYSDVLAAENQPLLTPDPLTMVIQESLALVSGELGGWTILPGAYTTDSSITIAAGTVVTLRGNADSKFLFLSGSSIVTGADTTFNLVSYSVGNDGSLPLAENICFMSAGATTTGANSVIPGSILSGAAVTLGAASVVTGGISAKAAITLGAASRVAGDIFTKAAITVGAGSSYENVLNEASVQPSVNTAENQPLLTV
jgi:cytoskeletal protein CcmA (bactofilin family)